MRILFAAVTAMFATNAYAADDAEVLVLEAACTAAVEEILAQRGMSGEVIEISAPVRERATLEQFLGTVRPEVAASRERALANVASASTFDETLREIFEVETIDRYALVLTLGGGFRSSVTGSNELLCTVTHARGRSMIEYPPSSSRVRINEATALDHLRLRLPL